MEKNKEFFKRIDWKLLRNQKDILIALSEKHPQIEGVINLLDSIQDYAVDVLEIEEAKIFNLSDY